MSCSSTEASHVPQRHLCRSLCVIESSCVCRSIRFSACERVLYGAQYVIRWVFESWYFQKRDCLSNRIWRMDDLFGVQQSLCISVIEDIRASATGQESRLSGSILTCSFRISGLLFLHILNVSFSAALSNSINVLNPLKSYRLHVQIHRQEGWCILSIFIFSSFLKTAWTVDSLPCTLPRQKCPTHTHKHRHCESAHLTSTHVQSDKFLSNIPFLSWGPNFFPNRLANSFLC